MNTPEELDQLNQSEDKNTQDIFPQGEKQPGVFSGSVTERETAPYGGENSHAVENGAEDPYVESQPSYGNDPYASQSQAPYGNDPHASQNQAPYGNDLYASQSQNPYGNSPYGGQNQNPYGNNAYGGQMQNPYGNNAYGGQNQNPYGNSPYGGQNQNPYGNSPYGGQNQNPYGNSPYGGQNQNPYGNNPYINQNQPPYGNGSYCYPGGTGPAYGCGGTNPYSPYAVPQKRKTTTGVIIFVSGLILLFLIAVFALIFKMARLYEETERRSESTMTDQNGDGYERYFGTQDPYDEDFYGYDDDYGYSYGYDGDEEYDYDSQKYYELHDAVEEDLSYSVSFEEYEYETDLDTVVIMADYPVIKGDKVPNLDSLNETIRREATKFEEIFKEQYEDGIEKDGRYYDAYAAGYVTYMDEEKLSIVFSENVNAYDDVLAYLYCINIDMEKGVVLENAQILSIDDAFSVDFRTRSDVQNGEISDLTYMTDQQITQYFLSDDVIVFYTPKGMEIGFNYENGWVTVTYEEYEQYLKVF